MKRVFIIVLDSFGVGNAPDAAAFGDFGSNTLASIAKSSAFHVPVMAQMRLFNLEGVDCMPAASSPTGSFVRLQEASMGKDTTIGHWEIAGVESPTPLPLFPDGFPPELIQAFEERTGRKTLCNRPFSGTAVLEAFGEAHMRTGDLIVYTSADSVWQLAAHEDIVPVEQLYDYCQMARELLTGPNGVGRVIARPFLGADKHSFVRTANRHDFSLPPPKKTMLDYIANAGLDTIGVGKIYDIFAGRGVQKTYRTKSNAQGMETTLQLAKEDFSGLAFINLVDFDMLYGHRNDVDGYAAAMTAFDKQLGQLLPLLRHEDLLLITADHGCDPATASTDHSRECVPLLLYGAPIRPGVDLKTRHSFAHIASTASDYLGVPAQLAGKSLLPELRV